MPKFEFGSGTTVGETLIIDLKNNYNSMDYFGVMLESQDNAFIPRNVKFVYPSRITFELVNGVNYISSGKAYKYMFVGK